MCAHAGGWQRCARALCSAHNISWLHSQPRVGVDVARARVPRARSGRDRDGRGRFLAFSISEMLTLATPFVSSLAVAAPDAARLYGRFAEKTLYLDKNVGACCHSACSGCEWRDPEGGYRFDLLKANFPKWLPCYLERDFCDERGCHVPTWAQQLFPDGSDSAVSREDFAERLVSLDFEMPMGPKGTIKPDAAEPSAEAVEALWVYLCGGEAADELGAWAWS